MLLTGTLVAVPLTLLQCASVVHHTGVPPTGAQVAQFALLDVLLAHAVYDADRARDVSDGDARVAYLATTGVAAAAASVVLWQGGAPSFVPPLLGLHAAYAESKPVLAPIKPFFVGATWVAATTYLPLTLLGMVDAVDGGDARPLCDALEVAAWSHWSDAIDAADDARKGIFTPAVRLGSERALALSYALVAAALVLSKEVGVDALSLLAVALTDAYRRRRAPPPG